MRHWQLSICLILNRWKRNSHLENDIRVSALSRYPEVITMEEQAVDEEELWKGLKKALDGAVKQFVETRTHGGRES